MGANAGIDVAEFCLEGDTVFEFDLSATVFETNQADRINLTFTLLINGAPVARSMIEDEPTESMSVSLVYRGLIDDES